MPRRSGSAPDDNELLAELWRCHGDAIRERCRMLMRDSEDAKEALSRTLLRVAVKLPKHRVHVADQRSWALALTYRVCMDLYRERTRRREDPIDDFDEPEEHRGHSDDPERRVLARELESVVIGAMTELPERLQTAMWLYVWSGSYRDVAALLDITEENARKRIQEARATMRGALSEYRRDGMRKRRAPDDRRSLAARVISKCGLG